MAAEGAVARSKITVSSAFAPSRSATEALIRAYQVAAGPVRVTLSPASETGAAAKNKESACMRARE